MEESILISIKKLLGLSEECKDFDTDIIIHINTVFTVLNQLGVGPEEGFMIEDDSSTWDEYIEDTTIKKFSSIKTYIYLKVKMVFDPSSHSAVLAANKETINELEWRLTTEADS